MAGRAAFGLVCQFWLPAVVTSLAAPVSSTAAWTARVRATGSPGAARARWTKTSSVEPWWNLESQPELQRADFCEGLWGLDGIPCPDTLEPFEGDDHVRITIYNIGGSMTKALGASVNKEFPIIPHVGVRVRGVEHFFSDHVENRASPVMNEMMPKDKYPQITFDLGKTLKDDESIAEWVRAADVKFNPEQYNLWSCNCNHFAQDFAEFLLPGEGVPKPLLDPVLDFTDSMLDNVPEWRRAAGELFMNSVSRLVVVSWGRVVRDEKERQADRLGVDRGK